MTDEESSYMGRNDVLQEQCMPANGKSQCRPVEMRKRLGSTTYRVTVYFSDTSRETLDDKVLRMIQNEACKSEGLPEGKLIRELPQGK